MAQDSYGVLAFIRIKVDGAEDIKFHTGIGSRFYKTSKWYKYIGLGSLVRLSDAEETNKTSTNSFTITINLPNETDEDQQRLDVLAQANDRDVIGQDVAMYLWEEFSPREPQLAMLARVETLTIRSSGAVVLNCYTAAGILDRCLFAATRYSDVQQQQIVDSEDRGLRFSNAEVNLRTLEFP